MGISNDIRPRRKPHHGNRQWVGFDDLEKHLTEIAPPHHPEHHHEKPAEETKPDVPTTESASPEQINRGNSQRKEQLEDQFFGNYKQKQLPNRDNKHHEKGGGWKAVLWLVIILLIGGTAYYKNPLKNTKTKNTGTASEEKDYAGEVITQDYVTQNSADTTGTSSQQTTATTQPEAATVETTAPSAPAIDRSAISLKVLNGNGITGSAEKVKQILVTAGFTVLEVKNAKQFSYAKTYLYYQAGKEAEAQLVNEALSGRETILQESNTIAGTYNVVVVVGKK